MTSAFHRRAAAALVCAALLFAACGDDTPSATADSATSTDSTEPTSSGHDHDHDDATSHDSAHDHEALDVSAWSEIPTIDLSVEADAAGGYNVHVTTTGFRFAPEHVNGAVEEGEGHAHLYVDGVKVARLYGEWFHLASLEPGTRTVTVGLNANDHAALAIGDAPIEASVAVEVPEAGDTGAAADGDEDPATDGTVVEISLVDGVVGGGGRIAIALGDTVTLRVTSDVADSLHLHGYDLVADLAPGAPAELTFEATIPGVFELETHHHGGIVLAELEIR